MDTRLQQRSAVSAQHPNLCPKCGSQLYVYWCERCLGTGWSGMHKCKKCGGAGTTIVCPNAHSHKLGFAEFARWLSGS
jgi:hypothetical protein